MLEIFRKRAKSQSNPYFNDSKSKISLASFSYLTFASRTGDGVDGRSESVFPALQTSSFQE